MGLLNQANTDTAPEPEQRQSIGDPEAVKQMVDLAYNQHFDNFKKILSSTNKKSVATQLPAALVMLLKRVEQDRGQPMDFNLAFATLMEVLVMVVEDLVGSVADKPMDMDTYTTILKNTLVMFLKSHEDIIPPEFKQKLEQAAQKGQQIRGKGRPSFLKEDGSDSADKQEPPVEDQPEIEEEMV